MDSWNHLLAIRSLPLEWPDPNLNSYPIVVRLKRSDDRGSCEECQHFRLGSSTTRDAFDVMLEPLKPQLRSMYSELVREEQRNAGLFEQDLDTFKDLESVESDDEINYQPRP